MKVSPKNLLSPHRSGKRITHGNTSLVVTVVVDLQLFDVRVSSATRMPRFFCTGNNFQIWSHDGIQTHFGDMTAAIEAMTTEVTTTFSAFTTVLSAHLKRGCSLYLPHMLVGQRLWHSVRLLTERLWVPILPSAASSALIQVPRGSTRLQILL